MVAGRSSRNLNADFYATFLIENMEQSHRPGAPSHQDDFGALQDASRYVLSETLAGLVLLAVTLGVGTLFLLAAFGVVVLIFRHAFGVEFPDPLDWLSSGGEGDLEPNCRPEPGAHAPNPREARIAGNSGKMRLV
jgi:hypothetical protein